MPDAPLLPPACVAALTSAAADGSLWVHNGNREEILRDVLDAFVAGEGSGPWEVQGTASDGSVRVYYAGPMRERPRGFVSFIAGSTIEARAVAAVLNYLEAK